MRTALAALLAIEATFTGLWVARIAPTLAVYDWLAVVAIVARAFVGAFQFASAWLLVRRLPPAEVFAKTAFVASAALMTIEIGFNVSPNSVFPLYRWPLVAAYWAYALACAAYLRATTTA